MRFALLALIVYWFTPAQAQKYGHIDSDEIVSQMPEYKVFVAQLKQKQDEIEGRLRNLYTSYQKKQEELNKYGPSMMEAILEQKAMEIKKIEDEIQKIEAEEPAKLEDYKMKLIQPINEKYLKAVNQVSKELGYTYIFDLSNGAIAYYPEETGDISEPVKKKLGI